MCPTRPCHSLIEAEWACGAHDGNGNRPKIDLNRPKIDPNRPKIDLNVPHTPVPLPNRGGMGAWGTSERARGAHDGNGPCYKRSIVGLANENHPRRKQEGRQADCATPQNGAGQTRRGQAGTLRRGPARPYLPRAGQAGTANEQPKTRICRAHLPARAKERNPGAGCPLTTQLTLPLLCHCRTKTCELQL